MEQTTLTRVTVRLPGDEARQLKRLARRFGRSQNSTLRQLIKAAARATDLHPGPSGGEQLATSPTPSGASAAVPVGRAEG